MSDRLFDPSWWMLALAIAIAITVWWQGNNRQDKTLKRAGLALLLLGCVWLGLSYFIDTDKESVTRKTRQIVDAVNRRDWTTFSSLLDERTSVPPIYFNRDDLTAGAKLTADAIGFKRARILGTTVEQRETEINVDFNALSEQERTMGQHIVTSWRFNWKDRGQGWKLHAIQPLKSQGIDPDEITRNLVKAR